MRLTERLVRGGGLKAAPSDDLRRALSLGGFSGYSSSVGGDDAFSAGIRDAYQKNGLIFALSAVRRSVLSEARFQYQQLRDGRPGELFPKPQLSLLETPWTNGTTGDLINRMMLDVDIEGNAFVARRSPTRLAMLKPENVTIILGSDGDPVDNVWDIDAEVIGYLYRPYAGGEVLLTPEEIAHFAPEPDPDMPFRGLSWVQTVLSELKADYTATQHKLKYFKQGATGRMVVTVDKDMVEESFLKLKALIDRVTKGEANAYRTLYLAGGADAKMLTANLKDLAFAETQGAGETRIAAAAGVPPIIAGLSEGLKSATYSNYGQARRAFADGKLRPLWRGLAGALATIVPREASARLWYDERDVSFLREDAKDASEIFNRQMLTYESGIRAGGKPDSVRSAVANRDITLVEHTGLFSVQLQPPGTQANSPAVPVTDPNKAIELIGLGWKIYRPTEEG